MTGGVERGGSLIGKEFVEVGSGSKGFSEEIG